MDVPKRYTPEKLPIINPRTIIVTILFIMVSQIEVDFLFNLLFPFLKVSRYLARMLFTE